MMKGGGDTLVNGVSVVFQGRREGERAQYL